MERSRYALLLTTILQVATAIFIALNNWICKRIPSQNLFIGASGMIFGPLMFDILAPGSSIGDAEGLGMGAAIYTQGHRDTDSDDIGDEIMPEPAICTHNKTKTIFEEVNDGHEFEQGR